MVYQCGLRLTARLKSGGPSLGRSPGAQKQRRPANQDQIQIFGEIRVDTILRAGFAPRSFFVLRDALPPMFEALASAGLPSCDTPARTQCAMHGLHAFAGVPSYIV